MLNWNKKTYVMGILNITPDSFSGDAILNETEPVRFAVEKAKQFISEGADILDLGAESSRPGSHPISAQEELDRLAPVITTLKKEEVKTIISVDTYKASVAAACLDIGADWINDIWGLQKDSDLAALIARRNVPVILMHNRSQENAVKQDQRLGSSYEAGAYGDFIRDITREMAAMAENALKAGIQKENIILDPGIGFGKTVEQNLELINRLALIKAIGFPVLLGPSRKSFIGKVLDLPVDDRLEGTAAAICVGILRGADIIRVHDVLYMARIAKMTDALVQAKRRSD